jgi:hypothetical protein
VKYIKKAALCRISIACPATSNMVFGAQETMGFHSQRAMGPGEAVMAARRNRMIKCAL